MGLYELVRKGDVTVYSADQKLDTTLKDFGEYNVYVNFHRYLADKLIKQAKNGIVLKGEKLEELLKEPKNLPYLTAFLTDLWVGSWSETGSLVFHVDVDIEKLSPFYEKKKK